MGRVIGGVLVAVLVSVLAALTLNTLAGLIFPPPRIDNVRNLEAVSAAMATRSTGNILLTSANFFLAALIGAWAGVAVARRAWVAWVAGGTMALFALAGILTFTTPGWAIAIALAGPVAAALIVRHLTASRFTTPLDAAPVSYDKV